MARLSKADVSVLRLVEDMQRLDLTNKRSLGEWVIRNCTRAKRADPRILALLDGTIPVDFDRRSRPKKKKTGKKKKKRRA